MVAERRADLVVNSILKYVTDIDEVKGLGFCVSIAHAQFMARYFNTHGIPSMALTGDSPDEERNAAKQRLVSGELQFLFVVDIYNEGVDIPEVNTVLFLRPTESLTVFLQQLGRGLILRRNSQHCSPTPPAASAGSSKRALSLHLKAAIFSWRNMPQNMCWIISAPPMTAPPGLWRGRLPLPRIPACL